MRERTSARPPTFSTLCFPFCFSPLIRHSSPLPPSPYLLSAFTPFHPHSLSIPLLFSLLFSSTFPSLLTVCFFSVSITFLCHSRFLSGILLVSLLLLVIFLFLCSCPSFFFSHLFFFSAVLLVSSLLFSFLSGSLLLSLILLVSLLLLLFLLLSSPGNKCV